jgi:hypothetical protein
MTQDTQAATALLIEHIADLEAAVRHVTEKIDPRLWRAVANVLEEFAKAQGWDGMFDPEADDAPWTMPQEWATSDAEDAGYDEDSWFIVDVHHPDEDLEDRTWLAGFVGVSQYGNHLLLKFDQQMLKARGWRALLNREEDAVQAIRDAGFTVEARDGSIVLPVTIVPARLAEAFADDDVVAAFEPLRSALARAAAARPHFDRLVAAARRETYGEEPGA